MEHRLDWCCLKQSVQTLQNQHNVQELTGLPMFILMESMFLHFLRDPNFLATTDLRNWSDNTCPDRSQSGGAQPSLDYFDQYFHTLLELRSGVTEEVIGTLFGISISTVSRHYKYWIGLLSNCTVVFFENCHVGQKLLQSLAKIRNFSPDNSVIDWSEIRIKTLKNPDDARKFYSNCKKAYTVKVLLGLRWI